MPIVFLGLVSGGLGLFVALIAIFIFFASVAWIYLLGWLIIGYAIYRSRRTKVSLEQLGYYLIVGPISYFF